MEHITNEALNPIATDILRKKDTNYWKSTSPHYWRTKSDARDMIEGTWMAYINLYPYLKSTGYNENVITPVKK
jgi:hypothetical protein